MTMTMTKDIDQKVANQMTQTDHPPASHPPTTWYSVCLPIATAITVEVAATSHESAIDVAKMKVVAAERLLYSRSVNSQFALQLVPDSVVEAQWADTHDRESDTMVEHDLYLEGDQT